MMAGHESGLYKPESTPIWLATGSTGGFSAQERNHLGVDSFEVVHLAPCGDFLQGSLR